MRVITKIEIQKNNTQRVSVYLNEEFAFGAFIEDVVEYKLKKGMTFTDEEYDYLLKRLQLRKGKAKALEYLQTGNKTTAQVKKKLKEKEFEESIIEEVIQFLREYEYINDVTYVERYVTYQSKYKHKSLKKIRYELMEKGVEWRENGDTVEALEIVECENIQYFLEKYKYKSDLEYKDKSKILQRLFQRGFSYEGIRKVMNKLDESFDR